MDYKRVSKIYICLDLTEGSIINGNAPPHISILDNVLQAMGNSALWFRLVASHM